MGSNPTPSAIFIEFNKYQRYLATRARASARATTPVLKASLLLGSKDGRACATVENPSVTRLQSLQQRTSNILQSPIGVHANKNHEHYHYDDPE